MTMKKSLYATTALLGVATVANGAHAEGINLDVGGFFNFYQSVGDPHGGFGVDDTQTFQDAEISFSGSYTLDNGIEAGVSITTEIANPNSDFQQGVEADGVYGYMKGSFGTVQLGSQNSAAYAQSWGAGPLWSYTLVPINTGWQSYFTGGTSANAGNFYNVGGSTHLDFANDAQRIAYYTPRVAGFKFGASWAPEIQGNNTQQFGFQDSDTTASDGLSASVSWSQDFQQVGLSAYAGVNTAQAADGSGNEDPEHYMAGVRANFAGFGVGYAFAEADNPDAVSAAQGDSPDDGRAHGFDVVYSTGPFTFQAEALISRTDGNSATPDADQETYKGAVGYNLGPGINLSGGVIFDNQENNAGVDSDAVSGVIGTTMFF
ncbi:porin [Limimonas halophila]|uniref:Porin n=1 Tax=Limimonas halophila TaxID=1082479 RepID=A0A1G7SNZ7_9PROT|nr:porin [Limimonas halophila]SDG24564.1 porin [Limimonas halophila]